MPQYKRKVLDHGLIRLVSYMQPTPENQTDDWSGDLEITRNARVSYDASAKAGEDKGSDHNLINFLYKNGHNTPFEAMSFTFEIRAPIFVFRQWHRHRTQSYNELSARYRPLPEEFYVPEPHVIGKQNADNKQMRDNLTKEEYAALPFEEQAKIEQMITAIVETNKASFATYRKLIEGNMPRELARSVLPVGTYSHMFATVNLNNLFKFITERIHSHAQYEIRVYAEALLELIEPIVPSAVEAFKKTL